MLVDPSKELVTLLAVFFMIWGWFPFHVKLATYIICNHMKCYTWQMVLWIQRNRFYWAARHRESFQVWNKNRGYANSTIITLCTGCTTNSLFRSFHLYLEMQEWVQFSVFSCIYYICMYKCFGSIFLGRNPSNCRLRAFPKAWLSVWCESFCVNTKYKYFNQ